ncbi:MAG: sulfur carrier protein ThiS [Bryobacteraceae bacterium]
MEAQQAFVEITVNGERRHIPSDQSVAAMLSWLQLPSDRVAVELNRTIVRKRDWELTVVTPASQIEVVEFVGGG